MLDSEHCNCCLHARAKERRSISHIQAAAGPTLDVVGTGSVAGNLDHDLALRAGDNSHRFTGVGDSYIAAYVLIYHPPLAEEDRMVRVNILWQTTGTPTHNEQVMLQLEPHEAVIRAARLRLNDDRPISYELVSAPVALLPRAKGTFAHFDIHQLAAANRIRLGHTTERASQVAADRLLAKHLGIPLGSVVNMFDRLILTDVGQPIEWRIAFVKA